MQGNCPDTMVQEAGPCEDLMQGVDQLEFISNIFSFMLRANVSALPEYNCAGSGPMRGFCIRAFRLLWANSSSSAMSAYLHHGPMQAFFLAALPLLARTRVSYGNLVCAGWTQILLCRKWAPARILHKGFQAAVSQLKLISNIRAFTTQGQCKHFSQQHSHCRPA